MSMKQVGIVGLGDMGMGIAKNIIKNGFPLTGFDLRDSRMAELETLGGKRAASCREVGESCDVAFVMVLNGDQVKEAVLGPDGLSEGLQQGATIIVSATINPAEVRELEAPLAAKGINLIDTPVSGGKSGAEEGALTLMAAASADVLEKNRDVLDAISKAVFHVGDEIGQGQTVKAALQALIGTTFAAIFESLVLGAAAGIKGETLYEVFASSGVSSPLFKGCAKLIMERKFKDTGSQITTMYKDLGITMGMARETGAAMFATSAAYELFQSGISLFPEEDNWSIVKLLEQIAGTEVTW
jgi:3-hydroxyisobutyrate dehydrogenase-like beta-hydroxyacid dehydrogenase